MATPKFTKPRIVIDRTLITRLSPAAAAVVGLLLCYLVRPFGLFHGPVMLFTIYPALLLGPLFFGGLSFALVWAVQTARSSRGGPSASQEAGTRYPRQRIRIRHRGAFAGHRPSRSAWVTGAVIGFLAFVVVVATVDSYTARAVYQAYSYQSVSQLPNGGDVRLLPFEVAQTMAQNAYNRPGYSLAGQHLILDPQTKQLTWTFEQAPHSFSRKYFGSAGGTAYLNAESTTRQLTERNGDYPISPSVGISQNLSWQIYKHDYFTEVSDSVAVPVAASSEIVSPYIGYHLTWQHTLFGLPYPVTVPYVKGVAVTHPGGQVEYLSVADAAKRTDIVASGRLFPSSLARTVQDAYALKGGVLNASFLGSHSQQTKIEDAGSNMMPYLMAFGGENRLKWVSAAEPYGKARATNAIFLTDAITGRTEVWTVREGDALTGAERALSVVRSMAINGVTFAAADGTGGNFQPIEPRPLFINHQLDYLVSIIPNSATNVTKSVIVSASEGKVIGVFNNDSDPNADAELTAYVHSGVLPASASPTCDANASAAGCSDVTDPGTTPPPTGPLTNAELAAQIQALIASNAKLQAQLDSENKLLLRLIRQQAAKVSGK